MDATTAQQNTIALARVEVEVAYLKAAVARLDAVNQAQSEKLDKVLAQLAEARGGWRTVMMLAGAAGTVGSGVTWLISHWRV